MSGQNAARRGSPDLLMRLARMDAFAKVHFGVHLLAPFALLVVGIVLTDEVLGSTPVNCAYDNALLPAAHVVLVGIGALIVGRYLSRWTQRQHYAREDGDDVLSAWAWVWLFLLLSLIWLYEAIGTARVAAGDLVFEPITYYIRCAAYQDIASTGMGVWSMFVVAVISGLVGHWLWASHPTGGRRSP